MSTEVKKSFAPDVRNHPDNGYAEHFGSKPSECPADCYFLTEIFDRGKFVHTCALADSLRDGAAYILTNKRIFTDQTRFPGIDGVECPVDISYEHEQEQIVVPSQSDPANVFVLKQA